MKKIVSLLLLLNFMGNAIAATPIVDEFAERTLSDYKEDVKSTKTDAKKTVNYANTENLVVTVSIDKYVTTRNNIFEGQELKFTVAKDVTKNGVVIIPKGTHAAGRVELITKNGAFGSPADLTIGNFTLDDGTKDGVYLNGEIYKKGANRSYWVYPVGVASIVFLFAGLLVLTIRGGHAKIKPKQQYALNYPLPKL